MKMFKTVVFGHSGHCNEYQYAYCMGNLWVLGPKIKVLPPPPPKKKYNFAFLQYVDFYSLALFAFSTPYSRTFCIFHSLIFHFTFIIPLPSHVFRIWPFFLCPFYMSSPPPYDIDQYPSLPEEGHGGGGGGYF
jgi:hypothetical protein